MRKPLIGIISGQYTVNERVVCGLRPTYTEAVSQAGGIALLIVPAQGIDELRTVFERLDGILLAGGGDIDPAHYGMDDNGLVNEIDADRDRAELAFARWALAEDRPLLGICRGSQVANVALGGTLYRDIPAEYPGYNGLDHALWGKFPRDYLGHTVSVAPGSRLAESLGQHGAFGVNSLHHQALRDIPRALVVSARAEDGIVEGVEAPNARFYIGVQWHPEELYARHENMRRLLRAFVSAASSA